MLFHHRSQVFIPLLVLPGAIAHYCNKPALVLVTPIEYVISHARNMQALLDTVATQKPPAREGRFEVAPGSTLYAAVVWDPVTESPKWELRPSTLLDGLWLQFGQSVTRGAEIRGCAHCGNWFEAGRGTGRRAGSKFCSEEHKIAFHSLKRSKEK